MKIYLNLKSRKVFLKKTEKNLIEVDINENNIVSVIKPLLISNPYIIIFKQKDTEIDLQSIKSKQFFESESYFYLNQSYKNHFKNILWKWISH